MSSGDCKSSSSINFLAILNSVPRFSEYNTINHNYNRDILVYQLFFLGVLPIQLNLHDFIKEQHKQEFFDLLRGLKVMRTINSNTPKHQVLLAVWLLRTGNLHFDVNLSEECPFSLIAQCMIQFFEEEVETYWTAKCFYDIVRNFKMNTSKLIEISWGILEKEDPQLYKHLQMTRILYTLPLDRWFESAFACVIDASALAKYEFYRSMKFL